MTEASTPPGNLVDAVRQIGQSILGLARSRIALFGVELQEEKLRTMGMLAWFGLAFMFGASGLLVLIAGAAVFAWSRAGYAGLGALAAGCFAVTAVIAIVLRHAVRNRPAPFAMTAEEFRKDLECLRHR